MPGGNFYVSTSGNDSNPGTSAQPWRTIQKAASSIGPRSTVIVLSGDYPERVQVTRSGSSGAPITFKAQGTVTMKGFTVIADYISVIGFDISNTPDDWQDGVGIFLQGSSCDIEDNYIHFATRDGIILWADAGHYGSTSNCVVKNNRLYRNAIAGIEVYGRDNLVDGNEIWGTIQHHPNWANPPNWVDADGMRVFGSGHTIKRNYIHDITYAVPENVDPHIDCFQTWGASDREAAHDIVFEQNTCVNLDAQSPNEVGQGFMLQDADSLVIRNNIITAYRIVNTVHSANISIINNTFTGRLSAPTQYSPGGLFSQDTPGINLLNNIFYDIPGPWISRAGSASGWNVDYNSIYRSDGVAPDGSPHPHDLWGIDPAFNDSDRGDYHLRSSSELIDAGVDLDSVKRDFDGTRRPQGSGYDIGAFERVR
jgi:parallel beta-helix repeat protein